MEFLAALFIFGIAWFLFDKLKAGASRPKPEAGRAQTNVPRPSFHMPDDFVVFDLETTGLNPERNKIIEIGALRVTNQTATDKINADSFETLIKIKGSVPEKITGITGISSEMLNADGVPIEGALKDFMKFAQGLPLVAFNAKFDIAFLDAALLKAGLPPRTNTFICSLEMARNAWPGRKSYKLSELTKSMADVGTHRALADCQRALIVFKSACQVLKS